MWRAWFGFFLVLEIFLGIDYYNYSQLVSGEQELNFLGLSWASLGSAEYERPGILGYYGGDSWWQHASMAAPMCAALFGACFGYLRFKKVQTKAEIEEIKRTFEEKSGK
jgi:hypothetical protein